MEINLKATKVFRRNWEEYQKKTRIVVNQGGRGSSKTYSLAQLFLAILLAENDILLTVCRKTLPALKATAMKDFFGIMKEQGIYREENHNKTESIYRYGNNEIEFISIDEPTKIRGRKRQYLWMNETIEFDYEDFRQLVMRTERQIYMDYNPSDEYHWIYDNVLTRGDAVLIKSAYKDNPFLDKHIVAEIERLKNVDENYWRIYGLGERGVGEMKIYRNWDLIDAIPEGVDELIYGLDFGFNNPSALLKIGIKDLECYEEEMLYESYLTNAQLIEKMKQMKIGNSVIYADSAEPQRIKELKISGFNVVPADKDVSKGIDTIKSQKIHIVKNSVNLIKEKRSYSWKQKDNKILDEPVKFGDHLMDAERYAIHTHLLPKPKVSLEWL